MKPRLPYIRDILNWDSIENFPEVRALYYTEFNLEGGHPDFVYWRRKFEALDIEEKTRNELIKQAIDRMNHPEKYVAEKPINAETDREKRVKKLLREEKYKITPSARAFSAFEPNPEKAISTRTTAKKGKYTRTYGNIHHCEFEVPSEVYSNKDYRVMLNHARTLEEVEQIISAYYRRKIED